MHDEHVVVWGGRAHRVCAIAACVTLAAGCGDRRSWPDTCASSAKDSAAATCLAAFELTRDPATGTRAAKALEDVPGSGHIVELIATETGEADAWLSAGRALFADEAPDAALEAYAAAAKLRSAADVDGSIRDHLGAMKAHLRRHDYPAATREAAAAYDLAARANDPESQALAYMSVGGLMLAMNNPPAAAKLIEQARETLPIGSSYAGVVRSLEGNIEQLREHPLLATRAFLEARVLAQLQHNPGRVMEIDLNLVDLEGQAGRFEDAAQRLAAVRAASDSKFDGAVIDYYAARLAFARGAYAEVVTTAERSMRTRPNGDVALLHALIGKAHRRLGHASAAESELAQAIAAVEKKRGSIDVDSVKSWELAKHREPFEELIALYLEQGRTVEAFSVVQHATARSILDGLLDVKGPVRSLRDQIVDAGQASDARHRIARSLRASSAAPVPPIEQIMARLSGRTVVTYFQTGDDLWAIVLQANGALVSRRLGSSTEALEKVAAWRTAPDAVAAADALGALLLPAELLPPPGTVLFVVPDHLIADVTFASLRHAGAYLVSRNPISYAPSAGVLAFARVSEQRGAPVVIGDPTGDLPHAQQEAIEVADLLTVKPKLGRDATVSTVIDAVSSRLLHVACHTDSVASGPALRLADGVLDAAGVLDRGIAAQTVVLLGCASAKSSDRSTVERRGQDELGPLASAFVASGAEAVVASRWAVEDDVGRRFARAFYKANGADDPITATAVAQRQLAREGVAVAQWSTFVVLGGLSPQTSRRPAP